ncbi:MAG: galactokinase family protein [Clostridia bacterium]|nr:galactokinase family protein [Clostridia bacterium]
MARALDKNYFLNSSEFRVSHKELYNNGIELSAERYSRLTEGLTGSISFFSSPGRAELIGNHTDHNNGFVLAATVDLDTVAAVVSSDGDEIIINSEGYPQVKVCLCDYAVNKDEYGTSSALVRGVIKGFLDRGFKIGGFTANTSSNIFKGAGVSSSAAFELLLCEILNVLYNGGAIDCITKAVISQYAENEYFGKPSGLMDQLTISRGGVSFMDFADTKMPVSECVKWDFSDISPVIINCGGDHCNLTAEYAEIRQDMHDVAAVFGKPSLRGVAEADFYKKIAELHKQCGGRAVLRAKHFFDENARVKKALSAINNNDAGAFLELINQSGVSSYEQLQNCYAKSDAGQNIPLGLHFSARYPHILAKRVHGGGFAGTILVMLEKSYSADFAEYMKDLFGGDNIFNLCIRNKGTTKVEV